MSLLFMRLMLCVGALDEPLGELATTSLVVEPHHVAVVVDLLHGPAGTLVVGARSGGHGDVPVDGDRGVRGVVGALRVPGRRSLVFTLPQPRLDHGVAAPDRVVVGVVAVL